MLQRSRLTRSLTLALAAMSLSAWPGAAHAGRSPLGAIVKGNAGTQVGNPAGNPKGAGPGAGVLAGGVGGVMAPTYFQADLVVETLEVTELPGNQFSLHAVLRNGANNPRVHYAPYPGGGNFILFRTSGGTTLNPPGSGVAALPAPGQTLASVPIPPLDDKQTFDVTATTTGRAIFRAYTSGAQDAEQHNNGKEVDTLISHTIPLNRLTISAALGATLASVRMRLDRDDASVTVPGIADVHGKIPEESHGIDGASLQFYLHDINLNTVSLDVADKSLIANLGFETNGDEIIGYLHTFLGDSDSVVPNLNADSLRAQVKLPLGFDRTGQRVTYQSAQVTVTANWTFTGPLGWGMMSWAQNTLMPDINGKIARQGQALFNNPQVQAELEYQMNQVLHQVTAGGRITWINFDDPDQPVVYAELPQ
jgi:hypothetical protein